jgi:hypothetical protein
MSTHFLSPFPRVYLTCATAPLYQPANGQTSQMAMAKIKNQRAKWRNRRDAAMASSALRLDSPAAPAEMANRQQQSTPQAHILLAARPSRRIVEQQ